MGFILGQNRRVRAQPPRSEAVVSKVAQAEVKLDRMLAPSGELRASQEVDSTITEVYGMTAVGKSVAPVGQLLPLSPADHNAGCGRPLSGFRGLGTI